MLSKLLYNHHVQLPLIGSTSVDNLKKKKALIIDLRRLRGPAATALANDATGHTGLIYCDIACEPNLTTPFIYSLKSVEKSKPKLLNEKSKSLYLNAQFSFYWEFSASRNAPLIFGRYNLIIDATDSFITRNSITQTCELLNKLQAAKRLKHLGEINVFPSLGALFSRKELST